MNALLQETASWTDTVDLALCLFIYEVCNDCCNLQIFLCLFLEKLNMPQNTPVTKAS